MLRKLFVVALLLLAPALAGCASPEGDAEGAVWSEEDEAGGAIVDEAMGGARDAAEDAEHDASAGGRMEKATEYFETASRYSFTLVETKGGETTSLTSVAYLDREVPAAGVKLARTEGDVTKKSEQVGYVGNTTYWCESGECRIAAGVDPEEDATVMAALSLVHPTYFVTKAGLSLVALATPKMDDERVDGVKAWRFTYPPQGSLPSSRVWIQQDPVRYLRSEIVVSYGTSAPAQFLNATFSYEDTKVSEAESRAVTLALVGAADRDAFKRLAYGSEDGLAHWNFTVQPTVSTARVALSDVTLRVTDRYDNGIIMSLENLTASDDRLALAFEDKDADGFVSAGDMLRIEVLSTGTNRFNPFGVEDLNIELVDEKGWTATPA